MRRRLWFHWFFMGYHTIARLRQDRAQVASAPLFAWQAELVESFDREIAQREAALPRKPYRPPTFAWDYEVWP